MHATSMHKINIYMYLFECIKIEGERRVEKGLSKIFLWRGKNFYKWFSKVKF